jgi:hypothetical protein
MRISFLFLHRRAYRGSFLVLMFQLVEQVHRLDPSGDGLPGKIVVAVLHRLLAVFLPHGDLLLRLPRSPGEPLLRRDRLGNLEPQADDALIHVPDELLYHLLGILRLLDQMIDVRGYDLLHPRQHIHVRLLSHFP